jgi:hypothetical protein
MFLNAPQAQASRINPVCTGGEAEQRERDDGKGFNRIMSCRKAHLQLMLATLSLQTMMLVLRAMARSETTYAHMGIRIAATGRD